MNFHFLYKRKKLDKIFHFYTKEKKLDKKLYFYTKEKKLHEVFNFHLEKKYLTFSTIFNKMDLRFQKWTNVIC